MKTAAENLRVGNKIKVAGTVCKIRGIQRNNRNGVVLNLRILGMPYPATTYNRKAHKARRRAEVTIIVDRKTVLKLVS